MNIVITGSTGFTGQYVVSEFLKKTERYNITLFVRSMEKAEELGYLSIPVEVVVGGFDDRAALNNAFRGQDALINIASLGFGHAPRILDACKENNLKRLLFISTTGIFTKLNPSSKELRILAEEEITASGIPYTIIRPTMIYGTQGDRNMVKLIRFIRKSPVIPVFGSGEYLQQPIHVADLAKSIIDAFESDETINRCYNVAGKDPLSYNDVIRTISKLLKKKIYIAHIPQGLSIFAAGILEIFSRCPIVKREQIQRLNENKDFSYADASRDFNFSSRSFSEGIAAEILSLGDQT